MQSLSAWFKNLLLDGGQSLSGGRIVTVIGSGGKTSLIWRLTSDFSRAASLAPGLRILVTPTTKMFVPEAKFYDRSFISGELPPCPAPGVTLAGVFNEASGKLESFPPEKLKALIHGYDLVLIEGDGSRGRPFKAWAENEPVVPSFTDLTIGVLPLAPIGKPVSESLVHRLPLFIELTGAKPGEPITPEHILALITVMFDKTHGKKVLFFNQAEEVGALKTARELAESLSAELRSSLRAIIAGSVRDDWVTEL